MWVGRLAVGTTVELPDAPFVHLFVARGEARLDGRTLSVGDAVRLTGAGPLPVEATTGAELIVWESDQAARD